MCITFQLIYRMTVPSCTVPTNQFSSWIAMVAGTLLDFISQLDFGISYRLHDQQLDAQKRAKWFAFLNRMFKKTQMFTENKPTLQDWFVNFLFRQIVEYDCW